MRMEPPLHPSRWSPLREVLLGQFVHRRNERCNAGDVLESIPVRLALVEPGERIECRHQQERTNREYQHDQRQIGKIIQRRKFVPAIYGVMQHPVCGPESNQRHASLYANALQNVLVNMVPEFMGKHGLNLVSRIIVEKGVR